jgi:polyisoprenoid-binding protein YceI
MKKVLFSLTLMVASISLFSFTNKEIKKQGPTYTVDAKKSKVNWTGSKTSDFHTGYFPVKSGSLQVVGGKLTGGSFVIDIAGNKVTDESADFFDAAKFGEANFTITAIKYITNDKVTITGDLTLKGTKASVTFPATIRSADRTEKEKGFFAEAFFPLDRTVFGVSYGVGMIDSDVQLAVHIYASK